jgi:hypothetical protein
VDELTLGAVSDESGVDVDTLRASMRRLERLCPPLAARRSRGEVKAAEMARLALDLPAATAAMLRVKALLPVGLDTSSTFQFSPRYFAVKARFNGDGKDGPCIQSSDTPRE